MLAKEETKKANLIGKQMQKQGEKRIGALLLDGMPRTEKEWRKWKGRESK